MVARDLQPFVQLFDLLQAPEEWEALRLEALGTVHQVREIEVGDVVARDHVRVALLDESLPSFEHLALVLIRDDL